VKIADAACDGAYGARQGVSMRHRARPSAAWIAASTGSRVVAAAGTQVTRVPADRSMPSRSRSSSCTRA